MSKLIEKLINKNLISPPSFLKDTIQYLCITGSAAYGVANIDSDLDIYGYCIPPKSILFPHMAGYIQGLDKGIPKFDQWQQHHITDSEEGKEYDFSIYSILKYFRLVMDGNPNMIDTLFVPRNLIIHTTKLHEVVRENRKLFLSKKVWHTFKGYSYSQLHKMSIKSDAPEYHNVIKFEDDHKIDRKTKFLDIEQEMKLRGLL